MLRLKSVCYLFVALALLVLVTTTVGGVLHHHQSSTSENACPICHLNHQPIEGPLASDRGPILAPLGIRPEAKDYEFSEGLVIRRIPARAPPAA